VNGISRREDIEGRRVLNLLGELSGGGEAEDRVDPGFTFKNRSQSTKGLSQVRRGRDHDFRMRGSLADGREQSQA
jgi:hypothetical protein